MKGKGTGLEGRNEQNCSFFFFKSQTRHKQSPANEKCSPSLFILHSFDWISICSFVSKIVLSRTSAKDTSLFIHLKSFGEVPFVKCYVSDKGLGVVESMLKFYFSAGHKSGEGWESETGVLGFTAKVWYVTTVSSWAQIFLHILSLHLESIILKLEILIL